MLYVDGQSVVANPLAIFAAVSYTDKGTFLTSMRCSRKSHEPMRDPGEDLSCVRHALALFLV